MLSLSYPGNSLSLKVSPSEVSFGYSLNTSTTDTTAGKVVQILSTSVQDMIVQSNLGASRGNVNDAYRKHIQLVRFCRDLMLWQAKENEPATFTFPRLSYDLKVFLRGQTFSDSLTNITYPYTLMFAIDEDVNGVATTNAMAGVFSSVKKGVGFTSGVAGYHGGNV